MNNQTIVVVLKIEDSYNAQPRWMQYFVIEADKTTLVEMDRAPLGGWKTRNLECAPSSRDWPGMTVEAIVAWKRHNHDAIVCTADESVRVLNLTADRATR